MRPASLAYAVTALAALVGPCQTRTTLPRPECAAPRRAAVDYGAPSPRSTSASVAIEITGAYMADRVRQSFEKPLPASATDQELAVPDGQPNHIPSSGIVVKSVTLQEMMVGAERVNLLEIQITPWLLSKTSDPQHAGAWTLAKGEVQRYFALRLRLAPRLVTPATVPDLARRRALLGCGTDPTCGMSGAIVPLELYELYDVSNQQLVQCTMNPDVRNASYDIIAQPVHQGVLDALYGTSQKEGAAPLVLPGQKIVELVSGIAGTPVQLTGIAFGTDQNLKIGFLLDQGSSMPFSSATGLTHYPQDWGVQIDTSFITSSITKKITAATAAHVPPITTGAVTVRYEAQAPALPGGWNRISVDAPATAAALGCTVPVSIHAELSPIVRRNASNKSTIIAPTTQTAAVHPNFCIIFKTFLFGAATATVCTGGPCTPPPPDPCPELAEVEFTVGPGDVFYAIAIETDGEFYIAGRSTFRDAAIAAMGLQPRAAVPKCP